MNSWTLSNHKLNQKLNPGSWYRLCNRLCTEFIAGPTVTDNTGYYPVARPMFASPSNVNDASSLNSHLDKKQIHFQKANNQNTTDKKGIVSDERLPGGKHWHEQNSVLNSSHWILVTGVTSVKFTFNLVEYVDLVLFNSTLFEPFRYLHFMLPGVCPI